MTHVTRSLSPHRTLYRAGGIALVAHAALLTMLGLEAPRGQGFFLDAWAPLFSNEIPVPAATWVDLVAATPDLLSFVAPPAAPTVAAVADEARTIPNATAARSGSSGAPVAAADSGQGKGRPATSAFRRDRSTMRTRSDDGARTYQQARERTASASSSPQPIRQEPVVGIGDSSRTRHPRPTDAIAARPALPRDEAGIDRLEESDPEPAEALREAAGRDRSRSQGPLDAEAGKRRFDTERVGVAQDAAWSRATSNESHPGRMELSAPAASTGTGTDGHGPATSPGAVARPSVGTAVSLAGAAVSPAQHAADLAASAAERERQLQQAEIRRRVASALTFPHQLALMLEQGETVVHFVVRPDGRLASAVRVVKSAGFQEFDTAAVTAVTRAAPFPSMSRSLSVLMPIAFDNPVVR